ncbi:hypothetical protein JCM12298_30350 [Desulfothermus naphthae]
MDNKISGNFYFDPDMEIFKTHFPGHPVVPGSMIVDKFISHLKDSKTNSFKKIKIKNFKFLKFISPGKYSFIIEQEKDFYKCMLFKSKLLVATGEIAIELT